MPTPTRAAKKAKLGRISRSPSCGGAKGSARTTISVAHWQTKSVPARSACQRRSVATSPKTPTSNIMGETVMAVQTRALYQGSG